MIINDRDAQLIEQIAYENNDDPAFDGASAVAALAAMRQESGSWRREAEIHARYVERLTEVTS